MPPSPLHEDDAVRGTNAGAKPASLRKNLPAPTSLKELGVIHISKPTTAAIKHRVLI